jgi:glutamyl-tRNA reductase
VTTPTNVAAWVVHARNVPAAERERFASSIRGALGERALVLETCHRVEAYAAGDPGTLAGADAVRLPAGGRAIVGEVAIRHAIAVAVGADSVVVGEDQILHQLRVAVDQSRAAGTLDPVLERLFAVALHAGRRARSWRQGASRSLADVAIAAVETRRGALSGGRVVVVGAGEMGRLAVRAAARAGASVSIASRSEVRAARLARDEGAAATTFDPGNQVREASAIIVALRGPWTISSATADALAAGSAIVVDLSVPAAVPSEVGEALGDRLVTADDLANGDVERPAGDAASADAGEARSRSRVERLIEDSTRAFLDWRAGHDARTAADALARRSDRLREAELAALWREIPDLTPEARAAIDAMARHLAGRLLREPLERLGRDVDGRDERAVRELFAL